MDDRRGKNTQLPLPDLKSIYSRLAGYDDVNDAERLSQNPTFRLIGSAKIWERGAPDEPTSQAGQMRVQWPTFHRPKRKFRLRFSMFRRVAVALLVCASSLVYAQTSPCEMPRFTPATRDANMFTDEQVEVLGEISSQQLAREFKVIHDRSITSYLQSIADTLTGNIDPKLRVHVDIVDEPYANAFTFPGRRIYFTRKLLAFMKSEDEVAAVLAHEIGHVVTADPERGLSFYFRKVLGINSINSTAEVTEDYHRFLENAHRKTIQVRPQETEQEQLSADRIAVWTMARAGYKPEAFSEFWDRFVETKGKTGSWLGDFFGTTKPEQKRLRMAIKESGHLPEACVAKHSGTEEQFKAWQAAMLAVSRGREAASLHSIVAQYKLEPQLRPDLDYLRFSPDGNWVLAQDETSVYVLSRDPLAVKFHVHVPEAYHATFSPDSSAVSFYDEDLRVQRWNVATGKREFLYDVTLGGVKSCPDSALSPDGRNLVCIDREHTLRIVDVTTNAVVFERKNITPPETITIASYILEVHGIRQGSYRKAFSADGRYFVAAQGENVFAVDVREKRVIGVSLWLQQHLSAGFAFQGNDKVLVVNRAKPEASSVRRFPSGEELADVPLGTQEVATPTRGQDYIILRPIEKYPVGVMDVKAKKIISGIRVAAFDMYDRLCVSEGRAGEVLLFQLQSSTAQASAILPPVKLPRLQAAYLTPDFKRLAISGRARGAVWNLETGRRLGAMRGYRGVFLDTDGSLFLDFPRQGQQQRSIVRVDPTWKNTRVVFVVDNPDSPQEVEEKFRLAQTAQTPTLVGYTQLQAQFVIVQKPENAKQQDWQRNIDLTVYDVRTGKPAWSRHFQKQRPAVTADSDYGVITFAWDGTQSDAKEILSDDPALKKRLADLRTYKGGVVVIEVAELATGKVLGHLLVDTGSASFLPENILCAGDYVFFNDTQRRIDVYSLSSGAQLGRVFGLYGAITPAGNLLAVENAAGQLTIYDLPSMHKRDELTFGDEILYQRFSPDGKTLLIVTDEHIAYLVDVTGNALASAQSN